MNPSLGQITLDTMLGRRLHELAAGCRTIVEIGTWNGQGSTFCLFDGMKAGTLYSYEAKQDKHYEAAKAWGGYIITKRGSCKDGRCTGVKTLRLCYGTFTKSIQPFAHPNPDRGQFLGYYLADQGDIAYAPLATDYTALEHGRKIDLLLLDGGEWTSEIEFDLLYPRCHRFIALDDTNQEQSNKNHRNRRLLIDRGWTVLDDHLHDRHGWFIAQHP